MASCVLATRLVCDKDPVLARVARARALKFFRWLRGFSPSLRSNARRNVSASENPTEAAIVSKVRFGTVRRRFASLIRKASTNSAGVLPNTLLNARLKWLGDMHAFRASTFVERSAWRFRMIHGMSSENRSAGWLSNTTGFGSFRFASPLIGTLTNSCATTDATCRP